jgi:multiple sugar transport system ATP-binding protein
MTLADRIVLMKGGAIEQVGTPAEIYGRPRTLFVAGFIGTPNMNFVDVVAHKSASGWTLRADGGDFAFSGAWPALREGQRLVLGIRPADVTWTGEGTINLLGGVADLVEFHGNDVLVTFSFGGTEVGALVKAGDHPRPGERVSFTLDERRVHLFDADSGLRVDDGAASHEQRPSGGGN